MAKLNIDIGVNLGNSLNVLNQLKTGFNDLAISAGNLSSQVNNIKSSLGQLKSQSVNIKVNQIGGITAPKPVPNVFQSYTAGANAAGKATTYANMALTDTGRVIQDLPYGFIGISNNLNPLVESFRNLSVQAKASGTTMTKALLSSLGGWGAVGLAISAVSAALSFASIGLSYWTRTSRQAKDENEKFADSLRNAEASVRAQNIQLDAYIEIARDVTRSEKEQNIAIENANKLIGEKGKQITQLNKNTQEITNSVNALKDAWIQEALAAEYSKEIGKLLAEKSTKLQTRKEIIDTPAVNEAIGMIKTYRATLESADTETAGLRSSIKSRIDKLVKPYELSYSALKTLIDGQEEFDKSIGTIDKRIGTLKESYKSATQEASKAFAAAAPDTGKVDELRKKIDETNDAIAKLKDPLGKDVVEWTRLRTLADDYQKQLDKILGKQRKTGGTGIDSEKIKTLSDYFAEVQRDIKAINANPLTPFDTKQQQIAARLEEAIKYIVDNEKFKVALEADLKLPDSKFRQFQSQLSEARIKLFGAEQEDEFNQLIQKLKVNAETADILGTDRLPASISDIEGFIARLVEARRKFVDKSGTVDTTQLDAYANALILIDRLLEASTQKLDEFGKAKSLEDRITDLRNYGITIDTIKERIKELNKTSPLSDGFISDLRENVSESRKLYETIFRKIQDEYKKSKGEKSPFIEQLEKDLKDAKVSLRKAEKDLAQGISLEQLEKDLGEAFQNAFRGIFEGLADVISGGKAGDALKSLFAGLTEQLGQALIKFATSAKVVDEIVKKLELLIGTPGFGIIVAGALAFGVGLMAAGKALRKADGGYISGDGGPTSDSIPAYLSNGEYVIKAKSVSQYGKGFLDMINQGTFKRFAQGGLVTNIGIPDLQPVKWRALVNRGMNIPSQSGYIAETRISGQDLRLVLSRSDNRFNSSTSNPVTSKSSVI